MKHRPRAWLPSAQHEENGVALAARSGAAENASVATLSAKSAKVAWILVRF